MRLSGWGRYPVVDCQTAAPSDEAALGALVRGAHLGRQAKGGGLIARGNGRAYGDSAVNRALTVSMRRFNRMLGFDPETGLLTVEAGVILGDVVRAFLPRGWFVPVTPGTKFVTVGGMIAADVHGKNHHAAGSFGAHLSWLDVMDADGRVHRVRPGEALFEATVGGMGLSGIILRAAFRLIRVESAWIRQRTVPAANLAEVMAAFDAHADWTYSVAWIDCLARGPALGRSLLLLGEHARLSDLDPPRAQDPYRIPAKRAKRIPLDAPSWALNRYSVRAFNELYYWKGCRAAGETLIDWDSYFYPLDAILDWNRIYGRRGFVQFQCVLPRDRSEAGLTALLEAIGAAGQGSFLAVLKLFGAQESLISFPREGFTLALDFPATPRALALVDQLHRIAIDHDGGFYLAKDARLTAGDFAASEPRLAAFRAARGAAGTSHRFASAQSERLAL
ncbi:MAG: FAD-dependent oxidoreductase [Paracoccaceae bacterium]